MRGEDIIGPRRSITAKVGQVQLPLTLLVVWFKKKKKKKDFTYSGQNATGGSRKAAAQPPNP